MSADCVTYCPSCLAEELREYKDFGICASEYIRRGERIQPVRPFRMVMSYEAECRACGWRYRFNTTGAVKL